MNLLETPDIFACDFELALIAPPSRGRCAVFAPPRRQCLVQALAYAAAHPASIAQRLGCRGLAQRLETLRICSLVPPHSSHLLQPLDVVCYSLLKRHYGDGISLLARSRIYHINKETFLPAFRAAYEKTFTVENIRAGFRGAGLVPYDPDAV